MGPVTSSRSISEIVIDLIRNGAPKADYTRSKLESKEDESINLDLELASNSFILKTLGKPGLIGVFIGMRAIEIYRREQEQVKQ